MKQTEEEWRAERKAQEYEVVGIRPATAEEIETAVSEPDPAPDLNPEPIPGGFCVKMADDGIHCIDVIQMMYGWRLMLTDARPGRKRHEGVDKAWCYFGSGDDPETGEPRSMARAFAAAMLAARAWDGVGEPAGFNKVAGA